MSESKNNEIRRFSSKPTTFDDFFLGMAISILIIKQLCVYPDRSLNSYLFLLIIPDRTFFPLRFGFLYGRGGGEVAWAVRVKCYFY